MMKTKKLIKIKDDVFLVDVATTSAELHKGLSGTDTLEEGKGMLFDFSSHPKALFMVMRNMKYPLDFVFIKDNIIKSLNTADKDFKGRIESEYIIDYVLEINQGNNTNYSIGDFVEISDIEKEIEKPKKEKEIKSKYSFDKEGNILAVHEGTEVETFFTDTILDKISIEIKNSGLTKDEYINKLKSSPEISIVGNAYRAYEMITSFKGGGDLTYNEDEALKIGDVIHKPKVKDVPMLKNHMYVLDNDGFVIYNIKGKERIFSIPDTKEIINNVLAAEEGGSVEEVGLLMVNIFNKHDNNKPQFVGK